MGARYRACVADADAFADGVRLEMYASIVRCSRGSAGALLGNGQVLAEGTDDHSEQDEQDGCPLYQCWR